MQRKIGIVAVLLFCAALGLTMGCSGGSGGGNDPASSTSKEITSFEITNPAAAGVINESANTINVTVPFGTDVTKLVAEFVTTGVKTSVDGVEQKSSVTENNFASPVSYTVTAQDGTTAVYTVTVTAAAGNAKEITKFEIEGQSSSVTNGTGITVVMPNGTNLKSLSPDITHTGANVSPASGASQDFTNPVTYTVTAADGSQKKYIVTVTVAPGSASEITKFTIFGVNGIISGTDIALTVPYGSDLKSLVPTIEFSGASVSPESGVAQNFTNPVTYTVTAADGSQKIYTVTVTVASSSASEITKFNILGVNGSISGTDIALTVPYGSDPKSFVPTIEFSGANVSPESGVAQNFTNPVTYTVTAADGSQKNYTVTVKVAAGDSAEITKFTIFGVNGSFSGTDIALTVPYGSGSKLFMPTIEFSGASVTPASGASQDFTNPVTYTVTAANGNTKQYRVTVSLANPSNNVNLSSLAISAGTLSPAFASDITSYQVSFDNPTASITVTPTLEDAAASVTVNTIAVANGTASGAINLSEGINTVAVVVTAQSGITRSYKIKIIVKKTFTLDGVSFSEIKVTSGTVSRTNPISFPTGHDNDTTGKIEAHFAMSETDVTYELWLKVYNWATDPNNQRYYIGPPGYVHNGSDKAGNGLETSVSTQYPATRVSWREAMVWCNALTEYYNAHNRDDEEDLGFVYMYAGTTEPIRQSNNDIVSFTDPLSLDLTEVDPQAKGFRLPTMLEYEFAARYIGTTAPANTNVVNKEGVYYTKGDSASGAAANHMDTAATADVAVYNVDSTAIVKSKKQNALGLYDMSGNVSKWCFDLVSYNSGRRFMGGSHFLQTNDSMQLGNFGDYFPIAHQHYFSFRIARNK